MSCKEQGRHRPHDSQWTMASPLLVNRLRSSSVPDLPTTARNGAQYRVRTRRRRTILRNAISIVSTRSEENSMRSGCVTSSALIENAPVEKAMSSARGPATTTNHGTFISTATLTHSQTPSSAVSELTYRRHAPSLEAPLRPNAAASMKRRRGMVTSIQLVSFLLVGIEGGRL